MDHSDAHLMEYTADPIRTEVITSAFTAQEKEESLERGESGMHNKQQHQQAEYYKKLAESIRDYDEVVLFGPTDAKLELLNHLRADHRFSGIKIQIKAADKMSLVQQHAFVREYFSQATIK